MRPETSGGLSVSGFPSPDIGLRPTKSHSSLKDLWRRNQRDEEPIQSSVLRWQMLNTGWPVKPTLPRIDVASFRPLPAAPGLSMTSAPLIQPSLRRKTNNEPPAIQVIDDDGHESSSSSPAIPGSSKSRPLPQIPPQNASARDSSPPLPSSSSSASKRHTSVSVPPRMNRRRAPSVPITNTEPSGRAQMAFDAGTGAWIIKPPTNPPSNKPVPLRAAAFRSPGQTRGPRTARTPPRSPSAAFTHARSRSEQLRQQMPPIASLSAGPFSSKDKGKGKEVIRDPVHQMQGAGVTGTVKSSPQLSHHVPQSVIAVPIPLPATPSSSSSRQPSPAPSKQLPISGNPSPTPPPPPLPLLTIKTSPSIPRPVVSRATYVNFSPPPPPPPLPMPTRSSSYPSSPIEMSSANWAGSRPLPTPIAHTFGIPSRTGTPVSGSSKDMRKSTVPPIPPKPLELAQAMAAELDLVSPMHSHPTEAEFSGGAMEDMLSPISSGSPRLSIVDLIPTFSKSPIGSSDDDEAEEDDTQSGSDGEPRGREKKRKRTGGFNFDFVDNGLKSSQSEDTITPIRSPSLPTVIARPAPDPLPLEVHIDDGYQPPSDDLDGNADFSPLFAESKRSLSPILYAKRLSHGFLTDDDTDASSPLKIRPSDEDSDLDNVHEDADNFDDSLSDTVSEICFADNDSPVVLDENEVFMGKLDLGLTENDRRRGLYDTYGSKDSSSSSLTTVRRRTQSFDSVTSTIEINRREAVGVSQKTSSTRTPPRLANINVYRNQGYDGLDTRLQTREPPDSGYAAIPAPPPLTPVRFRGDRAPPPPPIPLSNSTRNATMGTNGKSLRAIASARGDTRSFIQPLATNSRERGFSMSIANDKNYIRLPVGPTPASPTPTAFSTTPSKLSGSREQLDKKGSMGGPQNVSYNLWIERGLEALEPRHRKVGRT